MDIHVTASPAPLFTIAGIDFGYGQRTIVSLVAGYEDEQGNTMKYREVTTVRTHAVAETVGRMRRDFDQVKAAVQRLGFKVD